MSLSQEDLKERISQIEFDLEKLRSEPNNSRKIEALNEYRDYLKDELARLKQHDN